MNDSAIEIDNKIKSAKNVLINMDTRTDYDALGCSTVFGLYLTSLGIKNHIIHANKIIRSFDKFYAYSEIEQQTDISKVNLSEYDLVIFLDTGSRGHISLDENFVLPESIESINFDHHETNEYFGKFNYVYKLGSCGAVLYKYFTEIKFDVPKEWLERLAVGMLTDSLFFKNDTFTSYDFRFAADMVDKGVKISEVISKLSSYEYIDQIKYKEIVYRNLVLNKEKKYAYSTTSLNEIREAGIDMENVFVRHSDLIKFLVGVDFTFVIAETASEPKYYELSFRSKGPDVNVRAFAEMFGGGGHTSGAGAKLYSVNSIEEALNTVKSKLKL